ncbi:DUF4209 domain-containing protein [uncultured Alistipes sp.]|uniref:DUF4209 domain-containing protein n=1 Tax=uncultured Alistipes sp. TaxID=538949 RepID=UPI00266FD400|nr:DUF4209 domain-containing protein [uncultured Alistipes sp.]
MTVQEILSEFDIEGKRFDFLVYASQYYSCDDAEKSTTDYQAELMASELTEDYTSDNDVFNGRFYFGPYQVYQNNNTGEFREIPDRKLITAEMISYWEIRINNAKNIILKARYSGLVWDFKLFVTGEKCDIAIARTHIQSLICVINNDYLSHPILGVKQAERAIKLSKKLGQADLLNEAKLALHNLISRHGKGNAIGIWGSAYRISTECPNSYTSEEQKALIADLETRFIQIYDMPASGEKKRDPWLLMDLADILSGYYKKCSPDKIEDLFEKVEESFDAIISDMAKLQLVGTYSQLYKLLVKYGLQDKAAKLSIKIAKFGEGIQDEMAEFKQEFTISKEDMDSYVNSILYEEDVENSLGCFTYSFIPKKEREKESLEHIVKGAPFLHMIPQSIFDEKGRVKAIVGGIETDLEGNLVVHISMSMKFNAIFINAVIEEGKQRGIFTIENILSFITKSPSIKMDRIPIVTRGLEAYFNQDYLVSTHLLIPQLEEAIRNILEIGNVPTLKPTKSGKGFQLRILDEMLRDPIAVQLLTDDFANYLRILLTDNRGWNLRNDICHGIASPDLFNKMTADRIIHALLCFGVFRIKSE